MRNDQLLHQVKTWWAHRDGKPEWAQLTSDDKKHLVAQWKREQDKHKARKK
jgi:hypothetical protein